MPALIVFAKSDVKNRPGYVLRGDPPRWHKVASAPHADAQGPQAESTSTPIDAVAAILEDAITSALAMKLPASNTNAKTFNAKIDDYVLMLGEGKINDALNTHWGINTYGKKITKHAAKTAAKIARVAGVGTPTPEAIPAAEAAPAPASASAAPTPAPEPDSAAPAPSAASPDLKQQILAELDALKLPPENVNAKTFNKKLAVFKRLVHADDLAAMQAFKWGTNSYGKKGAKTGAAAIGLLKPEGTPPDAVEAPGRGAQTPDATAAQPAAEVEAPKDADAPKEGDTKVVDGVTYQLIDGRWHKVGPPKTDNDLQAVKQALIDVLMAKKLPESNTNATTVNKKLDAQAAMIVADDFDALANTSWGTNSYGKWLAKRAAVAIETMSQAMGAIAQPIEPPGSVGDPEDIGAWTEHPGTQGGYTPGGQYTDQNGQKWYVKFPADEGATRTEVLANALYALAGAYVPELKLITQGGKIGIASKWIEGAKVDKAALKAGSLEGLFEGFAADAWLANYDTVGNNPAAGKGWDNITNHNGKALRVEAGGALDRRGTGGIKPFPPTVADLKTFRDPAINSRTAAVFGAMTDAQIAASVARVAAISDDAIRAAVNALAPGTQADKDALAATLVARRDDMAKQYPPQAAAADVPADLTLSTSKGKLLNWSVTASSGPTLTATDAQGKTWTIAIGSGDAVSRMFLKIKLLQMFGVNEQHARRVKVGPGHWGLAGLTSGEGVGDPRVRAVIETWLGLNDTAITALPEDVRHGAERLALLKRSQLEEMAAKSGVESAGATVADLLARREAILAHFKVRDPWNRPKPDETKLSVNAADLPAPINFHQHPDYGNKPVSSKEWVNTNNEADSAALIAFAAQGNLVALQNYQYQAVDKETGNPIGLKPIAEHPSKHIKEQWADLVQTLQSIAYPPVESLSIPPMGDASTPHEVSEEMGAFGPEETIETIASDKRFGFFMKRGQVDDVSELKPKNPGWLTTSHAFVKNAKSSFATLSSAVKGYIQAVQASGWINHLWSQGKKTVSAGGFSGGTHTLTAKIYQESTEIPEGIQMWRWMNDSTAGKEMMQMLLAAKPGTVLQNTDSMCASYAEHWGDSPRFGKDVRMRIHVAKGARATPSFASGGYSSEYEITTLPGARFVVLSTKQGVPTNPQGVDLEVLMLPPDVGFVSAIEGLAALGKAFLIWFARRMAA